MARLRESKKRLKKMLLAENWQDNLDEIAAGGIASIGALFSFLLLEPEMAHRAALALGRAIRRIASGNPEAARNIIRNYMWHMNEDSGNIGWGIPEAFAETLAQSPMLAESYAGILISYIMDLGHADNYCDNDALRRSCYWAVGRLAQARPDLAEKARPWLVKGLGDRDSLCRGYAAWALGQLPPDMMNTPALRALAKSGDEDMCAVFDGAKMTEKSVAGLAASALRGWGMAGDQ